MNFFKKDFLIEHCHKILTFYDDRVVDETGGYFQNYYDNGEVFEPGFRQLVSSTRIVVNYCQAAINLKKAEYLSVARHGLEYIENVHWQPQQKMYAWTLQDHRPLDMTQQAYGYAFVLLAYANAKKAGLLASNDKLLEVYQLLEERFWQADYGLYADEMSSSGELSSYRGQNANMHLCEAMIAAYEATQLPLFIKRAIQIAESIVVKQTQLTDGFIWEHYKDNFQPDWEYNKDDPKNLYRPWGFQPGHQTEWTKLLLLLYRHEPLDWLLEYGKKLFEESYQIAWDEEQGGLIYGFDREKNWCDDDKYFWVQAESFVAAALLYDITQNNDYLNKYQAIWQYCWDFMIDHQYGAWYRVLDKDNKKYSNEKSAAGAKCDYHNLGACFEVLKLF